MRNCLARIVVGATLIFATPIAFAQDPVLTDVGQDQVFTDDENVNEVDNSSAITFEDELGERTSSDATSYGSPSVTGTGPSSTGRAPLATDESLRGSRSAESGGTLWSAENGGICYSSFGEAIPCPQNHTQGVIYDNSPPSTGGFGRNSPIENSRSLRVRFFDFVDNRDYSYHDLGVDRIDRFFQNFWTNLPKLIVGLLIAASSFFGLFFLIASLFSGVEGRSGLPSTGGFFTENKPHPDWLSVFDAQFDRLREEASKLKRRSRLIFGLGLISFSVSVVMLVILIDATLNDEIDNFAQSISLISPIIIFQTIAAFFVRQVAITQKELGSVRVEISNSQRFMSAGLASSGNEEAFAEFVKSMNLADTENKSKSSGGGADGPSPRDIRTMASVISALSRATN